MAKPDPLLFTFFNEIGIIDQLATTLMERALPDGLKLSHFSVLNHFVRLGGERTPLALASAFQVTKGAMTNTLGKLEAKGLVRIRPNPDDSRSKLVSITAKGRKARDKAIREVSPQFVALQAQFPMGKIEKMIPALQNVRATLDRARDQ